MSKCARNQKLEIFEPDRLKIPKFPVPQDYRDSVATFADFNNHQKIPDNDQNTFAFTDFKSCIDRPVINQHRFKIFQGWCVYWKSSFSTYTGFFWKVFNIHTFNTEISKYVCGNTQFQHRNKHAFSPCFVFFSVNWRWFRC